MRKVIVECAGNTILFALIGLAFLFPASSITRSDDGVGFNAELTFFPILLIVYFIAYPIIKYILSKKNISYNNIESELTYSDEREKIIVAEATKISYKALMFGLILSIGVIGAVKLLSTFIAEDIGVYPIAIALLSATLIASTVSYCVKWCAVYRK